MSAPSAVSGSSGAQTGAPNTDALASIITQVQPGQQPARAPQRRKPQPGSRAPTVKPTARPAQQTSPAPPKQPEAISEKSKTAAASPSTGAPTVKAPVVTESSRPASPRKKRKKKPGFFESLLAFLTCSAPAIQDGHFKDGQKSREAPTLPKHGRKQTASTESKEVTPPTSSAAGPGTSSTSNAAVTGTSGPPTPSVPAEPIDDAALASQEGLANTSREGVSLPRDETGDVLSGAVVPPGKEGGTPGKKGKRKSRASTPALATGEAVAPGTEEPEEVSEDEEEEEYAEEDEEDRLIMQGGMGIPVDEHGNPRPLLIDIAPADKGRKCLVLDLDETLVHSSFKMIHQADFVVPVEIENQSHNVYVIKRPGVDLFLQKMGEIYEVVVFTASLSKYADPVLDHLDISRVVKHRLFRESCYNHRGNYVKDLSQLGRPISETIIIDNSPASYIFHPKNAVPVSSWFNDPHDTELTDLLGVLTDLADVPDVRGVLDNYLETDSGGFGLDQSMEQLSALASSAAVEHSTLQHQASQRLH